ncbi:hypothetical protein BJ138DRAFT_1184209 [Hygrophoropsis aurantiaca]|uniref:Uncharacterized protein n=1 Tax=Hygrophoropsis aurantiaca TaxID=72124 RepID=A0ACB7ZSR9_9AGAM|nr:hypothetical protein BJ138DRAFT_1184209 [Hygrophoropsis aurantiaca]
MSDDEDDYLSDKFLFPQASAESSTGPSSTRNRNRTSNSSPNTNSNANANANYTNSANAQAQPPANAQAQPPTYAQLRRQAQQRAERKNAEHRARNLPRRVREREALEEGLGRSLFERAREGVGVGLGVGVGVGEEVGSGIGAGIGGGEGQGGGNTTAGGGNKALGIMMKMGFKIGESLGRTSPPPPSQSTPVSGSVSREPSPAQSHILDSGNVDEARMQTVTHTASTSTPASGSSTPLTGTLAGDSGDTSTPSQPLHKHAIEPLPINEWTGKKGIGLVPAKRPRAPSPASRLAKMARLAKADSGGEATFRDRTAREYEARRAEGRLGAARRTCAALDEKAGAGFNLLLLDPSDPESIPTGLIRALEEYQYPHATTSAATTFAAPPDSALQPPDPARLRAQMQADALVPLHHASDGDDVDRDAEHEDTPEYTRETVEEAAYFVRLGPQPRLRLLLAHLRETYAYCFWCGAQYADRAEMEGVGGCPGAEEEDHD